MNPLFSGVNLTGIKDLCHILLILLTLFYIVSIKSTFRPADSPVIYVGVQIA